jgi:hypothetical protein
MTGEVINLGEGRKSSPADTVARIRSASGSLPDHDPIRDVLDAMAGVVQSLNRASEQFASASSPLLSKAQLASVEQSARCGAQDGVRTQALTFSRLTAIVGGGVVLGVVIGAIGASYVAAERTVETQSILGAMPAADADALAKLVRLNPPASTWTFTTQNTEASGARSGSVALWLESAKPPPPR